VRPALVDRPHLSLDLFVADVASGWSSQSEDWLTFRAILLFGAQTWAGEWESAMEDITLQELKALVAANSRAIGGLEELQIQDREQLLLSRQQWQEELAASRREYDHKQASLERQLAASRQQWQEELAASRQQWQEELTASRREHDRIAASLERSIDYARQLGQLGNRIGELNEAAFYPSLERVLSEDFHMEVIAPHVRARRQGEELELDVLAYANEDVNTVFDVEIKTELDQAALDQILDQLRRFPRFFREHRGKRLYGVLAAVKIPPGLRRRVLRQGLYLATIRDDVFDVVRPEGFEPRAFPN